MKGGDAVRETEVIRARMGSFDLEALAAALADQPCGSSGARPGLAELLQDVEQDPG